MVLVIEPLDRNKHQRDTFSCGIDSLDCYLRQQAAQDLKRKIATVFILIDSPNTEIIAYYTLSAYTVEITELDNVLAKKLPRYPLLPATLLGRLAVDINYRGQHFGELMLIDALKKSLAATTTVASLALIAEAIDETAANFYRKYSFQQFKSNPQKFYLPMGSIKELVTN
jgi:predicted GNAT family N-acyltransferase